MIIEKITEQDIPELLEMFLTAHKESKYKHLPFDFKGATETVLSHCNSADALAVKCVGENKMAGYFFGHKTGFVFTSDPVAMETSYYVRPESRGSRAFLLLITYFRRWADENGLIPYLLPHFAEDNSKTYSALEKMGATEVGRLYTFNRSSD